MDIGGLALSLYLLLLGTCLWVLRHTCRCPYPECDYCSSKRTLEEAEERARADEYDDRLSGRGKQE